MGRVLYAPGMPGNKTGQALPCFSTKCWRCGSRRDGEGVTQRALMCDSDGLWLAKDRSGKLEAWEAPDLGAIIAKMQEASDHGLPDKLTDNLNELSSMWLAAKEAEGGHRDRRKIEDRMKSLIGLAENSEGTETAEPDQF